MLFANSWLYVRLHGGPVNSSYQRTPLHWAADGDHVDTVRCLVDKGADINVKERDGASE